MISAMSRDVLRTLVVDFMLKITKSLREVQECKVCVALEIVPMIAYLKSACGVAF
jgi:hypothetical protein